MTQRLLSGIEKKLESSYQVRRLYDHPDASAPIAEVAPRIRAVVTGGALGLSGDIIDRLPALEIIAVYGIGTDTVDLDKARRRCIRVTTTPDVLTDDVADMAMALLLATTRQLCLADRFVRAGEWLGGSLPLGHKVSGKKLGILGLGRVGRAIAQRAQAFSMQIAYTGRHRLDDVPYVYMPRLEGLAKWSDVLVAAASGGAESRNLIDATILDAIGPEGILINVARGSIVDETALVAALSEQRLGGAGLDVFVDEPRVPAALWHMDNVVLQPHRASATLETRTAMGDLLFANLAAHFAGRQLPNAILCGRFSSSQMEAKV